MLWQCFQKLLNLLLADILSGVHDLGGVKEATEHCASPIPRPPGIGWGGDAPAPAPLLPGLWTPSGGGRRPVGQNRSPGGEGEMATMGMLGTGLLSTRRVSDCPGVPAQPA